MEARSRRRGLVPCRPVQLGEVDADDARWVRGMLDVTQEEMADLFRVTKFTMCRIESGRAQIPGIVGEFYAALMRGIERFGRIPKPTPSRLDLADQEAVWHAQATDPRAILWGPEPVCLGQRYLRIFSAAYSFGLDAEPGSCIAGTCAHPSPQSSRSPR